MAFLRFSSVLVLLVPVACAADIEPPSATADGPRLLVASPESRIGGEARIEGRLRIRNGCVVIENGGEAVVPIFDASVAWTGNKDGIADAATGVRIGIGARLTAAAAYMRENGTGWSYEDIERHVGVAVPQVCGSRIVRVRALKAGGVEP